jgi:hypothetical protein
MKALKLALLFIALFPMAMTAQTTRPTLRAGVGVFSTKLDLKTDSRLGKGDVVAPAIIVEYNHPLTSNLSCAIILGAGNASREGYYSNSYHSEMPAPPTPLGNNGIIGHESHFSSAAVLLFRPIEWAEVGLGISGEFINYSHAEHKYDTMTVANDGFYYYNRFQKTRSNKYGIMIPIRLHVYSNDRIELTAFYNMQYYRQEKGVWETGNTYAGLAFGVKL